ncbi:SRPBCC family protein [Ancylomarina longa]|uniref:SRPBCC family protein n=1 Tax=Ancylomarina longa TaxID=2487017 RepID=A0A434AY79_9BACT|nr:SRPBCC family protein [Ancylomarina longa]RUT79523.1 hypothetical protein DLK05_02205 [Ancylomarina longa]
MKALKVTGIVILLLVLGFLSIGFFSPKQVYKAETNIKKPVNEVFQLFNDHKRISEWIPEVKSFEIIRETPDLVGSTYKMMIENEGKLMELNETLTSYKKDEMVKMEFKAGWMNKTNQFTFTKTEDGTQILANYTVQGNNPFAKSLFAFFTSMFRDMDSKNLNQFKQFAEKQNVQIDTLINNSSIN